MVREERFELSSYYLALAFKTIVFTSFTILGYWSSRRDLNSHALRLSLLKRVCLPVPPLEEIFLSRRDLNSHALRLSNRERLPISSLEDMAEAVRFELTHLLRDWLFSRQLPVPRFSRLILPWSVERESNPQAISSISF